MFCRDAAVFDLDNGVWFRDGEEGPGIVEDGTVREFCDVSVFARVREALLALWEGGPTNREGAGKRCEDCFDIWFVLIEDQDGMIGVVVLLISNVWGMTLVLCM